MEITNPETVILFVFFFVPGFISMKVYGLFYASKKTDFSKDLYEAIGISFINFGLFFWPIFQINDGKFAAQSPFLYYAITFVFTFITPILLTWVYYSISKSKLFKRNFVGPESTVWDWHFSKRKANWVIVTLKDGRKIGGKYGVRSRSSAYPSTKEIFIEDVWRLNPSGAFDKSLDRNEGILITGDTILTITFFK
ncbi:MAG: DUF6338 family protein [Bacteroidota bacterium]